MAKKGTERLMKIINSKAEKVLNNNVKKLVYKEVESGIKTTVYESYSPVKYRRNYGLYDYKNFQSETFQSYDSGVIELSVSHNAYTRKGKNLSKLIILGQEKAKSMQYYEDIALYKDYFIAQQKELYKQGKASDITPFWYPRDFMETARESLASKRDTVIREFEEGMRK